MSRLKWGFVLAAALWPLAAVGAPLIAMRVEVEAVEGTGNAVSVAIRVQIAPEDRGRLGDRALVQAELRQGQTTVDRVARTVDMSDAGELRLAATWPPGTYQLRVDVEGSATGGSGFWVGTVTIPALAAERPGASEPLPETPSGATPAASEEAVAPPVPEEPVPSPPPEVRAEEVSQWGSDDPALADLTLVVTDRNRPVVGLTGDHVQVRVDGSQVPIEAFGDATAAPLYLVVAVDVSTTMRGNLPEVRRQVGKLALTTLGHGGSLALVTADAVASPVLGWTSSPAALAEALTSTGSAAGGDLAGLVGTSLAMFAGHRGRRFLLVVTDGGDTADRARWQDVSDVADAAGIPILVVGLDGEHIENRARRSFQQLADTSGGRSYFLNSLDVLSLTLDYMAELIDGSYALQVRVGGRDQLHKVRVTIPASDYEVYAPRRVR